MGSKMEKTRTKLRKSGSAFSFLKISSKTYQRHNRIYKNGNLGNWPQVFFSYFLHILGVSKVPGNVKSENNWLPSTVNIDIIYCDSIDVSGSQPTWKKKVFH